MSSKSILILMTLSSFVTIGAKTMLLNNFTDLLSIIFPTKIKVKSNLLSDDVQQELVAKPQ